MGLHHQEQRVLIVSSKHKYLCPLEISLSMSHNASKSCRKQFYSIDPWTRFLSLKLSADLPRNQKPDLSLRPWKMFRWNSVLAISISCSASGSPTTRTSWCPQTRSMSRQTTPIRATGSPRLHRTPRHVCVAGRGQQCTDWTLGNRVWDLGRLFQAKLAESGIEIRSFHSPRFRHTRHGRHFPVTFYVTSCDVGRCRSRPRWGCIARWETTSRRCRTRTSSFRPVGKGCYSRHVWRHSSWTSA